MPSANDPGPAKESPPAEVFFPLTVALDLCTTAQDVLRRECGAQIGSIRLERVPNRHEMRLWVTLAAAAHGVALHALVLELPAAEIGAVKVAKADALSMARAA